MKGRRREKSGCSKDIRERAASQTATDSKRMCSCGCLSLTVPGISERVQKSVREKEVESERGKRASLL